MARRNGDTLQAGQEERDAIRRWREKHGAAEEGQSERAAPREPASGVPVATPPGPGAGATGSGPPSAPLRSAKGRASGDEASRIPSVSPSVTLPRGPSGRLAMAGVFALMIAAWGGLVPFLGPAIRFSGDGTPSWYWDAPHALLWLVPGAVAFVAAAAVLGFVPTTRRGRGRVSTAAAGFAMAVCGAWFVVGPLAWPVLKSSAGVFVPASPLRELDYQIIYSLGPGMLLLLIGGMVIGWGLRRRPRRREAALQTAPSMA